MAERIPGVKRMEEFAAEPSTSWAETAGNFAGEGAQLLAGPGELKWGAKLASQFPKATYGGQTLGFFAKQRPWVKAIGTGAEYAGRGAAAGAMSDPEDPGAGAALGAITGAATPAAGRAMRSQVGQFLGAQMARGGPYAAIDALAVALGLPPHALWNTGLAELILWQHAPGGSWLGKQGRLGARKLGRLFYRSDPRIPGAAAGGLEDLVEQQSE